MDCGLFVMFLASQFAEQDKWHNSSHAWDFLKALAYSDLADLYIRQMRSYILMQFMKLDRDVILEPNVDNLAVVSHDPCIKTTPNKNL